jgi:hypothetical protein
MREKVHTHYYFTRGVARGPEVLYHDRNIPEQCHVSVRIKQHSRECQRRPPVSRDFPFERQEVVVEEQRWRDR